MTTEMKVRVEQVDRQAVEDSGLWLTTHEKARLLRVLAKHRLAERERIVAWLRDHEGEGR